MSVIPCEKNKKLGQLIREFAETLKTEAHTLGSHGLEEKDFYQGGLFRGAIERIRGQFAASMREKREFVKHILNHMQDNNFIQDWDSAGDANRHDYVVKLNSGRIAVIELKGCLDGNNTNIFERPTNAQEFIIWSVCTNLGADPRRNAWSGIHTRLSAEIISKEQCVDGVIIWDWLCGTVGRPCLKVQANTARNVTVGPFEIPPPCIYVFPATIPSTRNNPNPKAQNIQDVQILKAFHDCFGGESNEINYVSFEIAHKGAETVRKTKIKRAGVVQRESEETTIKRS